MFWKPHGKPINLMTVEDGQYVEGYVKPLYTRRKTIKEGRIYLKKSSYSASVYITCPGRINDILMGTKYYKDGKFDYYSPLVNSFKLYDGERASKRNKNYLPHSGILKRTLERR